MINAQFYAIDIESDTSISPTSGLDPNVGGIVSIALAGKDQQEVFDLETHSTEAKLLREFVDYVDALTPGVLLTWNGSVFDFPFIRTRTLLNGIKTPLKLRLDTSLPVKYQPTPGYLGGYRVRWGDLHDHLDVQNLYRKFALREDIKWSLKPVAKAKGFDMVEVDRENIHLLTAQELKDYVLSDAVGTYQLGLEAFMDNPEGFKTDKSF